MAALKMAPIRIAPRSSRESPDRLSGDAKRSLGRAETAGVPGGDGVMAAAFEEAGT